MKVIRAKLEKLLLQRADITEGKKNYKGACVLALESLETPIFLFKWIL